MLIRLLQLVITIYCTHVAATVKPPYQGNTVHIVTAPCNSSILNCLVLHCAQKTDVLYRTHVAVAGIQYSKVQCAPSVAGVAIQMPCFAHIDVDLAVMNVVIRPWNCG